MTAIDSLRLLGIDGGLTSQPSVTSQPIATLIQWQALQTPSGAVHLVGYCTERREGRVSTRVASFDVTNKQWTTASGRTYVLSGTPGRNSDAFWVWEQFAAANGIRDVIDVTAKFEATVAGTE